MHAHVLGQARAAAGTRVNPQSSAPTFRIKHASMFYHQLLTSKVTGIFRGNF